MIVNKLSRKCQSCQTQVKPGKGFAYMNGGAWFTVCNSSACFKRLGLKAPGEEKVQERKLLENGTIIMGFDRDAIPLLRSLPGARWDATNKVWIASTHAKDLGRLLEVADQLKLEVPASLRERADAGTPESVEAVKRANKQYGMRQLFDFQKEGVRFLSLHNRAILADDMGLGKTAQALVALSEGARVIIVCPASLKYNWKDEASFWRPEFSIHICNGVDSFVLPEKNQIVIINYDILPQWLIPNEVGVSKDIEKILAETTIIGDECHLTKNYEAKRSQKYQELCKRSLKVWNLTGTPLLNRATDLYGILQSGNMGNVLGSWEKFVELFNGYKGRFGYEFGMPTQEVSERLKRVMLRRLKVNVLKDLPAKTYQQIKVNGLNSETIKTLDKFVNQCADESGISGTSEEIIEALDIDGLPGFTQFSKIRAILAESRIPAMLEIVESYEDAEEPLVVFSAHKKPIEVLGERDGWAIITGDVSSERRRDIVNEFQSGKLKGVGLTISAGGTGLTLTRASNVLFIDLDWTPGMNIQAEDRVCRIGQKASGVIIKRMVSSHPLDIHIQNLIERKMQLAFKALEQGVNFKPLNHKLVQDVQLVEESEDELIARINAATLEAERTIAMERINSVFGRECAKVSEVPEPELTPERKDMLRNALDYMLSRCDGAETIDGMGFSKPDVGISRWIAKAGLRDDEQPFRLLERMLVRYRRQLKNEFKSIWGS